MTPYIAKHLLGYQHKLDQEPRLRWFSDREYEKPERPARRDFIHVTKSADRRSNKTDSVEAAE